MNKNTKINYEKAAQIMAEKWKKYINGKEPKWNDNVKKKICLKLLSNGERTQNT